MDRGGICGLDLGAEGDKVGGARALNCGNGGEYGLSVRIHISPFATVHFILLHSHDVQSSLCMNYE